IPRYHATRIVGNVLVTPAGNGASPIWFGGDQGLTPWYRKGVVDVVHNTFVIRSDQSQVWKLDLIRAASPAEAIDARGNVIAVIPDQAGGNAPELGLVGSDNRIALGRNRVPAALRLTTADDGVFRGAATGVEWLIRERAADPGFVSAMTGDYRLGAGSVSIDAGPRLPDRLGAAVLASQFRSPVGGSFRSVRGTAPDLGAFEFGAPAGRASTTVAMAPPTGLRVRVVPGSTTVILDWIDRSKDESLFVVERSWTGRTWQVIATAAANTTSFVDTSARPGRTSVYRIRAVDTTADPARWSAPSSAVRVRLP
ncbi:MAG: fibronectin type III domain-containing protein, partial [Planctomycetia bacterium]|nr:fibronectin type III domain-containing protein [Planctomycetia bacterium]